MSAPEGYRCAKPVVWLKAVLREVTLPPGGIAVASALAMHADRKDGKNACPGLSRLEWESGASRHTVVATLENLESMRLVYCAAKSTGRGHASVYWLTLHDEMQHYGMTYEAWLRERRPADRKPRKKGFPAEPIEPVKGSGRSAKGFRGGAQRVPAGTAPVVTREELTSSVLTNGLTAPQRADDSGLIEITSDPDDLCGIMDELDEALGLDPVECSTADGMLQSGSHPQAVINKILADRRA